MSHPSRRRAALRTLKHDIKLELDVECQRIAEDTIRRRFPAHAILGEEDAAASKTPPPPSMFQWIIDPIDGTVNFSHGLPWWCCSIAVRHGGQVLAGAVYAPQIGELYTATDESPARLNGSPLRVSACSRRCPPGSRRRAFLDRRPSTCARWRPDAPMAILSPESTSGMWPPPG